MSEILLWWKVWRLWSKPQKLRASDWDLKEVFVLRGRGRRWSEDKGAGWSRFKLWTCMLYMFQKYIYALWFYQSFYQIEQTWGVIFWLRVFLQLSIRSHRGLQVQVLFLSKEPWHLQRHDFSQPTPWSPQPKKNKRSTTPTKKYVQPFVSAAFSKSERAPRYVGICGQGPSDHPDLAKWLMEQGIDSVSLNPDSVSRSPRAFVLCFRFVSDENSHFIHPGAVDFSGILYHWCTNKIPWKYCKNIVIL